MALSIGACTGETSFPLPTWDAGAPGHEYASPCSSWAKTVCAWELRCLTELASEWVSSEQCLARQTTECELLAADPAVPFNAPAVASCQYPSDCSAPTPGFCLPPGKSSAGAACQWNDDCASGFCDIGPNSPCGTCVAVTGCDASCSDGESCARSEDGGSSCIVPPVVGQPCQPPDYVCADGGICDISDYGQPGSCIATATAGQSCGLEGPPVCFDPQVELFCDETMHCRPFLPAMCGQACGAVGDAGDSYQCIGWASCEYAATSLCVQPAGDGTLCDEEQGLSCLPPARCIDNECLFPSPGLCTGGGP